MAKNKKTKAQRRKSRRDYSDFEQYVTQRPTWSANELIKGFRVAGGSIGRDKGVELVREYRGTERNLRKVTRIKYYSAEDYPLGRKEIRKRYIKARYIYVMAFDVEREGYVTPDTDYITIASPIKLDYEELIMETLQAWADGQKDKTEKYKAVRILPESIILIKAIDMDK